MEGYVRIGMDMHTAIERVNASVGLAVAEEEGGGVPVVAANTERALQELSAMMGGLA